MSINYANYIVALSDLLVATTTDANFTAVLQPGIDYAEQRLYRDLDLLNTVNRDSAALVAGNRNFNLPSTNGTFYVVDEVNVITPSTTTTADLGTRNPLMPTSKETLDFLFPSVNASAVPQYFAMLTQTAILVAPWPNAAYTLEVVGTIRPASIYTSTYTATNTSILSVYFPDLFVAASMVWFTGWQRDFGAQTTDPASAMSWEQQYQTLLKSAQVEEWRKKFRSEGWHSQQPSPISTPPRT